MVARFTNPSLATTISASVLGLAFAIHAIAGSGMLHLFYVDAIRANILLRLGLIAKDGYWGHLFTRVYGELGAQIVLFTLKVAMLLLIYLLVEYPRAIIGERSLSYQLLLAIKRWSYKLHELDPTAAKIKPKYPKRAFRAAALTMTSIFYLTT